MYITGELESTGSNVMLQMRKKSSGDAFYFQDEDKSSFDDAFDVMYSVSPDPMLSISEIVKYNKVLFQRGNGYNSETGTLKKSIVK